MISKSNILLFFKQKYFLQILMIIICLIPIFSGISSIPPLDRDESRFSQSSYQMVETNDYVNIKFQDEIRAKKPIGIYWLQALSAEVFGIDDIASYRLPSLFAAFLSISILWFFSKKIFGRNSALLITLLFSTNILFVSEAHIAKTDSVLLSLICLQQYLLFLIIFEKEKKYKLDHLIPVMMWLVVSLGMLIKGPISLIVFILTLITYCIIKKNISILSKIKPLIGLVIAAVILVPWIVSIQQSTDGLFLYKAIHEDFLPKLSGGQEGHGAYPGFYILFSSFILWPLACFLPISILFIFEKKNNSAIQFLLCWIIPYWLVLELVPTKLIHYPLPILPPLIMLISASLFFFEKNEVKIHNVKIKNVFFSLSTLLGFGGILFGSALYYFTIKFGNSDNYLLHFISLLSFTLFLCVFVLTTIKSYFLIYKPKLISSFWQYFLVFKNLKFLIILTSINYFLIFGFILPNLEKLFPSKLIFNELKTIKYDSISSIGFHEPSLVFFLKGKIILSNSHEGAIFLAEGKNNIVLIEERHLKDFKFFAKNLDLNLDEIKNVQGFNYSKGKKIKIYFYKSIH